MSKLRYDLVAKAILTLQKYLDACAEDTNTFALVSEVEKTIKELKHVERSVKQRHEAGKTFDYDLISAIAEIEPHIEKVKESIIFMQDFMKTYSEEMKMLKVVVNAGFDMAGTIGKVKVLERQLESVRSKVLIS